MADRKMEIFLSAPLPEERLIIDDILDQYEAVEPDNITDNTIESLDEQLIQALREAGY